MQFIIDFLMMLYDGIRQAGSYVGYFVLKIPSLFSAVLRFLSNVPVWIVGPVTAAVSLAVVLQVISFIPTESGGNS